MGYDFNKKVSRITQTQQAIQADGTILNTVVSITDQRDLSACRAARIDMIKAACQDAILAAVPYYKQANLANGFYDDATAQALKQTIQTLRSKCQDLETRINSAQTPDDVEKIMWE